ncbi:MAG: DNA polymerase III subunit gamma/tau, partial [Deltaproteobacteria bacterium]|nr:DNA polymerase III subunit gamma/tau [Deltaproteobacteria bacterium]
KTSTARILAKAINCMDGTTPTPCNKCDNCLSISNGSNVDVIEIDAASNRGINEIRELREKVKYLPNNLRKKVYIIDEVHMLSSAAFNALLKTLEEPPPHVVFIFATTESHKIPLTIHSRCQRFDFKRIPTEELIAHLTNIAKKEDIKIDEEAMYLIARESEGSLRDAQSLLEQISSFTAEGVGVEDVRQVLGLMDRSVLGELTGAILGKNKGECLKIVENIHKFGYDLKKVTEQLLKTVRDLAVIKASEADSGGFGFELSDGELALLRQYSSEVSLETLQILFSIFSRAYEEVSRSSTPRYALEMALLRATQVENIRPIESILDEIKLLKSGTERSSAGPGERAKELKKKDNIGADGVAPKASSPVTDTASKSEIVETEAENVEEKEEKAEKREFSVEGLLEFIGGMNKLILGPLKEAKITKNNNSIVVETDNTGFFVTKANTINELFTEYCGENVKMYVKKPDVKATKKEGSKPTKDKLVVDALRILGGKVIEERRREDV